MFTTEEWQIKIEKWKKSGLSQKNWCNLNGIKYRLKYWSARLKELKRKAETFDTVRFHEIKPIPPIGIKIKWQNIKIEIDPDFDENKLQRFLKALS